MNRDLNKHYLERSESEDYPSMDFETWYQQGMDCFLAKLPKKIKRQALRAVSNRWLKSGRAFEYWMLRAFAYGATGRTFKMTREPLVSDEYCWPEAQDSSWDLVVCCYQDGCCELDFVHPVSRRFLSETEGFFDSPDDAGHPYCSREWYERLGFEIIFMQPGFNVKEGASMNYLSIIQRHSPHHD